MKAAKHCSAWPLCKVIWLFIHRLANTNHVRDVHQSFTFACWKIELAQTVLSRTCCFVLTKTIIGYAGGKELMTGDEAGEKASKLEEIKGLRSKFKKQGDSFVIKLPI